MPTALTVINYANTQLLDARPVLLTYQTTSQSFTSAVPALVQYQTILQDTANGFDVNTNAYTVARSGWYRLAAKLHWSAQTGGARYVQLRVNGSPSTTGIANRSPSSALTTAYMETLVALDQGDTVQLWGNQNSGSTVATFVNIASGYNSVWCMHWVSET